MKNILVNGKLLSTNADSLAAFIEEQNIQPPFAIAVNLQFVPQLDYSSLPLNNNDEIDIVSPMQGG